MSLNLEHPTITFAPPRAQIAKDDFSSKGIKGGATVNLGHYKKHDQVNSRTNNNLYKHTFIVQV